MICPVCECRVFKSTASAYASAPTLPTGPSPIGRVAVRVDMIFTCKTCEHQMCGDTTVDVLAQLNTSTVLYPLHMYEFVRKSYGDGWNARAEGRRLNSEELDNISMYEGWCHAQEHSLNRGGRAPPKGWGHATSKEFLKTEEACRHLKMISLSELPT